MGKPLLAVAALKGAGLRPPGDIARPAIQPMFRGHQRDAKAGIFASAGANPGGVLCSRRKRRSSKPFPCECGRGLDAGPEPDKRRADAMGHEVAADGLGNPGDINKGPGSGGFAGKPVKSCRRRRVQQRNAGESMMKAFGCSASSSRVAAMLAAVLKKNAPEIR